MRFTVKGDSSTGGNWQCPYCQGYATIRAEDQFTREEKISTYHDADLSYLLIAITCPNPDCRKLTLELMIKDSTRVPPFPTVTLGGQISPAAMNEIKEKRERPRMDFNWQLLPTSKAKIFPDFVPKAVRDDYEEACKIVNLSAKASATLARRCLQTIIRDFWGIKNKPNLKEEIDALLDRSELSAGLIGAFHDLRKIGNIGAHMEMDISLIIDVDPEEAETLIRFIENLIGLTYIEKNKHDELLENIKNINANKQEKKEK